MLMPFRFRTYKKNYGNYTILVPTPLTAHRSPAAVQAWIQNSKSEKIDKTRSNMHIHFFIFSHVFLSF